MNKQILNSIKSPSHTNVQAVTVIFQIMYKISFSLNNFSMCYSQNNDMSKKIDWLLWKKC